MYGGGSGDSTDGTAGGTSTRNAGPLVRVGAGRCAGVVSALGAGDGDGESVGVGADAGGGTGDRDGEGEALEGPPDSGSGSKKVLLRMPAEPGGDSTVMADLGPVVGESRGASRMEACRDVFVNG